MVFGSFLAGSSPEGGSAVAFPVFTKGLDVPSPVARTFGLSIQAVGMTMAVVSLLLAGRQIHVRAAVVGSVAAVVAFVGSVLLLGEPGSVFWPPIVGAAWVKATFSIVLATTSILMVRHLKHTDSDHSPVPWTTRFEAGLIVIAAVGGVLSSLTGTGANILVFLFLVVLADVGPKVALPTALVVMASVSVVGFVMFGLVDGQLDVEVVGARITSVGGQATDLAAAEADLFGMWLASVPVVIWGAPLGSLAASLVKESRLVRFVAVLAGVEVATTFLLVPELRSDVGMMIYLVAGLVLLPSLFIWLRAHRSRVFSVPG